MGLPEYGRSGNRGGIFGTGRVGIKGAGNACPWGLPGGIGGAPPPGRFGIAGAGLPDAGGGGGALLSTLAGLFGGMILWKIGKILQNEKTSGNTPLF